MNVDISENATELGIKAGKYGASLIRHAIKENGAATIILATGASQFSLLEQLVIEDLDWSKVIMFHLDEYIGMSDDHPASFRKYLTERFLEKIDFACRHYLIDGTRDPQESINELSQLISERTVDVAFIGIGENGHLAFNDPPADFEIEEPFIVVTLDDACRRQQFGEGWFTSLQEVPSTAISMSIRQIMKSKTLIVSVPDLRKAQAVQRSIEGPLTNQCPASILRDHADCHLFLDQASASHLKLENP